MADMDNKVVMDNEGEGTPKQVESTPTEQMIPKHRFDEVYGQMKTLQEQVEAINAEKVAKEKEELEKTNQYKTLYEQQSEEYNKYKTQVTTLEAKTTEYEKMFEGMVQAKLDSIPEDYRELVPSNLTLSEKMDWINKAESKGLFKSKVEVEVGKPTNAPPQQIDLNKLNESELLSLAYSKK